MTFDADHLAIRLRDREARCLVRPARDDLRDLLADATDAILAQAAELATLRRRVAGCDADRAHILTDHAATLIELATLRAEREGLQRELGRVVHYLGYIDGAVPEDGEAIHAAVARLVQRARLAASTPDTAEPTPPGFMTDRYREALRRVGAPDPDSTVPWMPPDAQRPDTGSET